MTEKSFTFDWHADGTSEFLKFIWISLMTGSEFQDLMERTGKGHSITLQVFANGVEVNAAHLMEGLERNFEYSVKGEVAKKVSEIRLEELAETIYALEKQIQTEIKNRFKQIGIELRSDEDW